MGIGNDKHDKENIPNMHKLSWKQSKNKIKAPLQPQFQYGFSVRTKMIKMKSFKPVSRHRWTNGNGGNFKSHNAETMESELEIENQAVTSTAQ